jgi:uncharacterized protein YegP (UPF0339 family)
MLRLNGEPVGRQGAVMAKFEVFQNADGVSVFRFRLVSDDGAVVAVSGDHGSVDEVQAAITAVRESAATGLVVDRSATGHQEHCAVTPEETHGSEHSGKN